LQYTGFVAMNPDRHATSHYDYFKDLIKGDDVSTEAHRKFYDEYNAVLDMDADYYLETIQTVFQDFKLVNGTWDVKGVDGQIERVRPQDIQGTALLTVEGELDDISGSGQTRAAQELCSGVPAKERLHLEVPGAGHYGIFSGRRWRDIVYPEVVKFIQAHSGNKSAKAPIADTAPVADVLTKPAAAAKVPVKSSLTPAKLDAKTVPAKATADTPVNAPVEASVKTPSKTAAKGLSPAKRTGPSAAKLPVKAVSKPTAKSAPTAKTNSAVKTSWVQPGKKA
jgi:poly(3-hydroxybutyrate) depolymerase